MKKNNSVNNSKLEALKKEVIEILKNQAEKEYKKALNHFLKEEENYSYLTKSISGEWIEKAGFGINTVRIWNGNKYRKVAPGKWVRIYEKEGRGTNIAVGKLIAQVKKIDNIEDLMNFALAHKQRFQDKNGMDLPILDKIRAAVDEQNEKLSGESSPYVYGVGENVNTEKNKLFNKKDKTTKEENTEKKENVKTTNSIDGKPAIQYLINENYDTSKIQINVIDKGGQVTIDKVIIDSIAWNDWLKESKERINYYTKGNKKSKTDIPLMAIGTVEGVEKWRERGLTHGLTNNPAAMAKIFAGGISEQGTQKEITRAKMLANIVMSYPDKVEIKDLSKSENTEKKEYEYYKHNLSEKDDLETILKDIKEEREYYNKHKDAKGSEKRLKELSAKEKVVNELLENKEKKETKQQNNFSLDDIKSKKTIKTVEEFEDVIRQLAAEKNQDNAESKFIDFLGYNLEGGMAGSLYDKIFEKYGDTSYSTLKKQVKGQKISEREKNIGYADEYANKEEEKSKKAKIKKSLEDILLLLNEDEEEDDYNDYSAENPDLFNSVAYRVANAIDDCGY